MFALNLAVSEVRPGNKHIQRVLGDEKDAARTKKRQQEYTDNVQGFLAYFRDTRRLVSVDVGQNSGTAVSTQLVQLLTALGFVPRSSVDPSFIFLPITKSKRRNSKVDTVENKWFGPGGPNKPGEANAFATYSCATGFSPQTVHCSHGAVPAWIVYVPLVKLVDITLHILDKTLQP